MGSNGLKVSHLQFADDTILFCEAEWVEVVNIKRILRCFEILSSLKINYHKSVICGIGVDDGLLHEFANRLNCLHQKLLLKYLGMRLGANPGRKSTWKPVLDKCKQKLASWKRRLFSFARRLTLIKSVKSSLPICYLSLFRIPVGVAKEIEKMQSAFLWGGSDLRRKLHLAKRDLVTKNKKFGSLEVRRIRIINEFLLLKWLWRFGFENHSLWKEVICKKYDIGSGRWFPSLDGRGSRIWFDIVNLSSSNPDLHNFYLNNTLIALGDGRRAHFWLDKWANNVCFKEEFPRLFSLSNNKMGVVSVYYQRMSAAEGWNLGFRRALLAWEEEEMNRLYTLLCSAPALCSNKSDELLWVADPSRIFSVSSAYNWWESSLGPTLDMAGVIWNNCAPPEAQFFGWLA